MTVEVEKSLDALVWGYVGRGVLSARVNEEGHLLLKMSDGQEVDVGSVSAELDATLSKSGCAADAKATGEKISGVQQTANEACMVADDAKSMAQTAQEKAADAQSAAEAAGQRAEEAWRFASDGGGSGGSNVFVGSPEDAPESADVCIDPDAEYAEALPNPYPLTFTGAVEGSYDGSAPMVVKIPAGGSSGGSGEWTLLHDLTLEEHVGKVGFTVDGSYTEFFALAHARCWDVGSDALYTGAATFGQGMVHAGGVGVLSIPYGGSIGFVYYGAYIKKYGDHYFVKVVSINGNPAVAGNFGAVNNMLKGLGANTVDTIAFAAANNINLQHFAAGSVFKVWGR